ncbi:enoyl-CoA hydratase/isomerase family protein [Membranihabitans marinus]|uniref:enoyl-CoA hydratase/isomerase family protein n=1 Tax=Membranihabitans marinus TaxID=1227546 RepID=UPI001F18F06A|nr:enoyl-CoA hydratase/isomerase family protein [Membranihabitans marinus]
MEGFVEKEVSMDGIAEIRFYHPNHNALPSNLLLELEKKILECKTDDGVKVLLLKSEGDRTFCAGADFEELMSISDEETGKSFFMGFARVINALRNCGKITIAQVQGKAVGGGVGICAAVDYAIASKWASVRLSELGLGIGPFVIGPAVERKIGLAHFSYLTLNAEEWQTAKWAQGCGLFQEVFDDKIQLEAYVKTFVQRFTTYHPEALKEIKAMLWRNTDSWTELLAERAVVSGRLVNTAYVKQAIERFKMHQKK